MGVRTTHAWRLGGFNPACHSGWLLYDNTKGLSIGGVCFFAIALQEHWNRLIARVFSNGADTSPQHKQTNKQDGRKTKNSRGWTISVRVRRVQFL